MIKLNVMELLNRKGKTKYWLVKQLQTDYNSVNKICNNYVTSLHLETIRKLCKVLECEPNDLFTIK
jgi:putative transcriptional regulator